MAREEPMARSRMRQQKQVGEAMESGNPPHESTPLRQVLKNALFSSGSWGIRLILTLISTPFIVHRLTIEGYGVYALLTGLVGYYSLLDLGLGQGVIKYVAEYWAKRDYARISLSINAALWVQICTGLMGSITLITLAEPILILLRISPEYLPDAKAGLYASAAGFFLTMLSVTLSSVLMGLQRYDVTSKLNLGSNSLLLLVIVLALLLGAGLKEIVFITAASAIIVFTSYLWIVKRNLPQWRFSFPKDKNLFLELLQFSGFLFMARISSTFGEYGVRFIVGFLLGPVAVTYYVVPWRMLIALGGLLSSAAGVLFPYTSEISALKDRAKVQRIFIEASRVYAAFSVPLHLALFAFSKPILTIWMGKDFAEMDWFVLSLLSLVTLFGSLSTVPNLITIGLGYARVIGAFSVLTLISYIILVPLFIKLWGIAGAAWGMLGSLAPGLALLIYETERIMGLRIWSYARSIMRFHLLPLVASFISICYFRRIAASATMWTLALVPLLMLVYFFLMVRFGWIPLRKFAKQFGVGA